MTRSAKLTGQVLCWRTNRTPKSCCLASGVLSDAPEPESELRLGAAGAGLLGAEFELLNVDPPNSPAVVLRGRIVTMNAAREVIEDGSLYMENGAIVAIAGQGEDVPAGFGNAPIVETGGTIYPGLLDLHNHLAYNIATLWKVPRRFSNRAQWQRHADYARNVKLPLEILTRDAKTARAIVRYVEVKAMLGGTTAVRECARVSASCAPTSRGWCAILSTPTIRNCPRPVGASPISTSATMSKSPHFVTVFTTIAATFITCPKAWMRRRASSFSIWNGSVCWMNRWWRFTRWACRKPT